MSKRPMRSTSAVSCLLAICAIAIGARAAGAQTIDFNRDIRPILSDNCYYCHGPDKSTRKADPPLRLDLKDGLFGERDQSALRAGVSRATEASWRIHADSNVPDATFRHRSPRQGEAYDLVY